MAFPFSIRPSSPLPPSSKPGQRQIPSKPIEPKMPAFGSFSRRPSAGQRQPSNPIIKPKPGFLEKGSFRQHSSLIHEIKKDSYYKDIPTYSKKFTKDERVNLITELEKVGQGVGGLSEAKLGRAIKKLEKVKTLARSHGEFRKVKVLDQKIKQAKVWQKSWSLRKN